MLTGATFDMQLITADIKALTGRVFRASLTGLIFLLSASTGNICPNNKMSVNKTLDFITLHLLVVSYSVVPSRLDI